MENIKAHKNIFKMILKNVQFSKQRYPRTSAALLALPLQGREVPRPLTCATDDKRLIT